MSLTLRAASLSKSAVLPICPAISAGMTLTARYYDLAEQIC